MARNSIHIEVPPADVWPVLEDPYAYPKWVVGTDRTLEADDEFPLPGSRFRVHLGIGLKDYTTSRELDPGKRIVLDAGSGYFGPARVTIELRPSGKGTDVVMVEDPAGKVAPMRYLPPVQLALRLRNKRSMRLFRNLVLQRARSAADTVR